jgi:hypothetical protein
VAAASEPFYPNDDYMEFSLTSYAFAENGKSVYPASGSKVPRTVAVSVTARLNASMQNANGTLTLSKEVRSFWGDEVSGVLVESKEMSNAFYMVVDSGPRYVAYPQSSERKELSFFPEAEEELPGTTYKYVREGIPTPDMSSTIPSFRTTKGQIADKCVPYIELKKEGDLVTGFTFRFVDPANPGVALTKNDSNKIWGLGRYEISYTDRNGRDEYTTSYQFDNGQSTEKQFTFKPIQQDKIHFIQVRFKYGDAPYVIYEWNIFVNPTPADLSAATISQPNEDDAKGIVSELFDIDKDNVSLVDLNNVQMNDKGALGDAFNDTISSVSFSQATEPGGAAVLGKVSFQTSPLKLDGGQAPDLSEVTDMNGLKQNYSIYKIFDNGAKIDLLDLYSEQFSYDAEYGEVGFAPYVVTVNDAAPSTADRTVDGVYGVKLIELGDGDYMLAVYDGKPDGTAVDPITFSAKPAAGGSSGGGCDAGAGMFGAFIALGCLAVARKRRG